VNLSNTGKNYEEILTAYPSIAEHIQGKEEIKYLEGIKKQHFMPEKEAKKSLIGSCIYEESCHSPLTALELIADKLGKDDSEDRKKLIGKGSTESAFLPSWKYYILEGIRGKSRIVSLDRLNPSTKIRLVMSSKGMPSLVLAEADAPKDATEEVNYGTVIVGPTKRKVVEDGQEVIKDGMTVWTIHAGFHVTLLVTQLLDENDPKSSLAKDEQGNFRIADRFGWKYGDEFTAEEVKKKIAEMAEQTKDHPNPRMRVNPNVYISIQ